MGWEEDVAAQELERIYCADPVPDDLPGCTITTTCESLIRKGLFVEPDDCPEEVDVHLEPFEEARELYEFKLVSGESRPVERDDEFFVCFGAKCPKCGTMLEWPQIWRVKDG